MFVIEKLVNDLQARDEAWERACQKWKDEHEYYSSRDYEKSHPRPSTQIKNVIKTVLTVLFISFVVFCGFKFIQFEVNQPPKPVKAASEYKNGDECGGFKVGDTGNIEYGDYAGAEVKIIGGCEDHADYEMEVTKDQTIFADGMPDAGRNDLEIKKGLIIKVDSSDNFKATGHEKEQ